MSDNKIIHYELDINQKTLDTYGQYVDFIHLPDDPITIRLVLKSQEPVKKSDNYGQIGIAKQSLPPLVGGK